MMRTVTVELTNEEARQLEEKMLREGYASLEDVVRDALADDFAPASTPSAEQIEADIARYRDGLDHSHSADAVRRMIRERI